MLNNSGKGDFVYEPFMGSGTTLIAAESVQRICLGIELNPAYVDVAILRWQTFTGQKATLQETAPDAQDNPNGASRPDLIGHSFEEIANLRKSSTEANPIVEDRNKAASRETPKSSPQSNSTLTGSN